MIRNLVIEFESAEPAIAEMKFDLLTQLPFKADAIAVADNEHPDHQLRIDRGPPDVAVERRQLLAKIDQHPRTPCGQKPGRNLAAQQAPYLMLPNPLCCPLAMGRRMQFDL